METSKWYHPNSVKTYGRKTLPPSLERSAEDRLPPVNKSRKGLCRSSRHEYTHINKLKFPASNQQYLQSRLNRHTNNFFPTKHNPSIPFRRRLNILLPPQILAIKNPLTTLNATLITIPRRINHHHRPPNNPPQPNQQLPPMSLHNPLLTPHQPSPPFIINPTQPPRNPRQ